MDIIIEKGSTVVVAETIVVEEGASLSDFVPKQEVQHAVDVNFTPISEANVEAPTSDLENIKAALDRAGTDYRSWPIHDYLHLHAKKGEEKQNGTYLSVGNADDYPYTGFTFDASGNLTEAAVYGSDAEVCAVCEDADCIICNEEE